MEMNLTFSEDYFRSIVPKMEEAYVDWPYRNPPLFEPFSFEVFDVTISRKWFWQNWTLTLYISVLYVIIIHLGQWYMKNRPPFKLQGALAAWNLFLAVFSFFGFMRVFPELLHVLQGPDGFHRSVCTRDELNPSSAYWAMLFSVSKLVELLDTAFVVARKSKLLFLHWYHHMATLIVSWMSYPQAEPIFRYVGAMNLFVHSIMYGYYCTKALKFNPPRKLAIAITITQISQMAVGLVVNLYAVSVKSSGIDCARSTENIRVQMWIYASYLVLFINYFYKAYFSKSKKKVA